ncbi:MAG: DUF983 domain-containing protein [Planctomycetes bacterium]|nr:DUF983 domain-containing protein [Planctomycetota bacterium]
MLSTLALQLASDKTAAMAATTTARYDDRLMEPPPSQVDERTRAPDRSTPVVVLWWRALWLRCPACGNAPIFRGWFAMHDVCGACGRRFNRGPGYLLGSIYFNYGVTAMLVIVFYFAMFFGDVLTDGQRLVLLSLFAAVFALWFFRYARALWMAFDERWDPWPNEEETRELRGEERGVRCEPLLRRTVMLAPAAGPDFRRKLEPSNHKP